MIEFSLRELESFIAVAEELNFTRAATRLRLAQPPLSRHVKTLEARLGFALFERSNRRVVITPAGQAFYAEVRSPFAKLQNAAAVAKRAARGETLRLEIGFVSSLFGPELAARFRHFRQGHPHIQLSLRDITPAEQLRAMSEQTMHGGFVGLKPQQKLRGIRFITWKKEPVLLFVPNDHPLARARRVALVGSPGTELEFAL